MGLFDLFSSDSDKKKCANCGKATSVTVKGPNGGKEFCSKGCMIEWVKKATGAS